ncbi:MAG: acyl-CoA dehydratase activase [Acidobacteriota bacterium]|jgi:predicted CoA-substrate-specific enzyme activase|nr:acyl-CoA dehydratase activase [Acidobacteriota bacterium]NLT32497.1 2-hydroxyglutaryl-CoA dehydratase [Acidobacteriota bacterium]
MYVGIDVGSATTKGVILDESGSIRSYAVIDGESKPLESALQVLRQILKSAGAGRKDCKAVVGTGYGRYALDFTDKTYTELSCDCAGARHIDRSIRCIIDIGAQDSKVIKLDEDGGMIDFALNDKCAAGTGRFLDTMARAMKIPLEEFANMSLEARKPCLINNTCTVFAESEVVSLVASGVDRADISGGLSRAIANRIGVMAQNLQVGREILFAGGVAKNAGVKKALQEKLELEFYPSTLNPQILGAIGAAVMAKRLVRKEC